MKAGVTILIIFVIIILIIVIVVGGYFLYKKYKGTMLLTSLVPNQPITDSSSLPAPTTNIFDITKYGATTSSTDNSSAIMKAFDAATSSKGTVYVPSGTFITSVVTIQKLTGVSLYISKGGKILGPSSQSAMKWNGNGSQGLVNFVNCDSFNIYGPGTIDGNGAIWWPLGDSSNRPSLLALSECKTVKVNQVTIANSAKYQLVITSVDSLDITRITISSPATSPNTDGIHIFGGGTNIRINNVTIGNGDDAIAINSGDSACNNITVNNVTVTSGHGVAIGSNVSNNISNVSFDNIKVTGTQYGFRIKAKNNPGKGQLQNISYQNSTLGNISQNPILITTHYNGDPNNNVTFSNISYKNISCSSSKYMASFVFTSPKALQNPIILDNVVLNSITNTDTSNSSNAVTNAKFTVTKPVVGVPTVS